MKIMKLIAEKGKNRQAYRIPTIVFLGDSVTQGCFDIYMKTETALETYFDRNSAYHTYIAEMLAELFPEAPVAVINAGISGDSAPGGLARLERDVLSYKPDLTVVCFGLNDSGRGIDGIPDYSKALRGIFTRLNEAGGEVIFMTPNMMNTNVSCHTKEPLFVRIAEDCARRQNEGVMDAYMDAARAVATECGVKICDVYAKWKAMQAHGADITELLANKINHPTKNMNRLFAYSLIDTMFS